MFVTWLKYSASCGKENQIFPITKLSFIAKETQIRSKMPFAVNQFSCFQCQKDFNCRTSKSCIDLYLHAYPKLMSLQISLKLLPMVLAGCHSADHGSVMKPGFVCSTVFVAGTKGNVLFCIQNKTTGLHLGLGQTPDWLLLANSQSPKN